MTSTGASTEASTVSSAASCRESTGWRRFIPIPKYNHVLMMLIIIEIILICIMLAGCTSESLSQVYLLSLSYNTINPSHIGASTNVSQALAALVGNQTSLQVRVGFMGLCASLPSGGWSCSSNTQRVASLIADVVTGSNESPGSYDPLDLVSIAKSFKDEVVFDGLLFVTLALNLIGLCLLGSFTGWHNEEDDSASIEREVKPFPSRAASHIVAACMLVSALMTLLSVFWQHLASAGAVTMTEVLTAGAIHGYVGPTIMGLGWAAVTINCVTFLGLLMMILSVKVLSQMLQLSAD